MMRFKHRKSRKTALFIRVAIILAICLLLLTVLDKRLRPVITTMAQYQCRVSSMLAMNEAIMQELEVNKQLTQNIITSNKNSDGTLTDVQLNANELNQLKTRLTQAVAERLSSLESQDIAIPLGTLLGWQLMAGRGPDITLRVVPASYVQADIKDKIETAGINQTKYGLFIKFTVTMSAILPGYSTSTTVENEVCIAQTLIVGEVPQVYAVDGINRVS